MICGCTYGLLLSSLVRLPCFREDLFSSSCVILLVGTFTGMRCALLMRVPLTQIIVPLPAKGFEVLRPLTVFGYDDAPHGHAECLIRDVQVPKENLILGEGRGFEVAQGRLGPGRIHHCMRLIGMCERALALHCERVTKRVAFGETLASKGVIRRDIAESRVAIEQARLLVLRAARRIDEEGAKAARNDIAYIKAAVPLMAQRVIDAAMQAHGAAGFSQDTPLAYLFSQARWLRMADGPDEVHFEQIAKMELKKHQQK